MKNIFLTIIILTTFTGVVSAQSLPPAANALYEDAVKQDAKRVKYATDNNATIVPTPDGNSFYIQWFPPGADTINTPLIVTLHGSNGYAFNEFYLWHQQAFSHHCGIIALQWYKGKQEYFSDELVYGYIDSALRSIHYPSKKALLHGFSRGAARSYALGFLDTHGGNNYFNTIIANSGAAMPGYPLYAKINAGNYGDHVFEKMHWILFCGGLDPNPNMSGCVGMSDTKTWLEEQGAAIDLFIQDEKAGHGGFHQTKAHIDSALNVYLKNFRDQQ